MEQTNFDLSMMKTLPSELQEKILAYNIKDRGTPLVIKAIASTMNSQLKHSMIKENQKSYQRYIKRTIDRHFNKYSTNRREDYAPLKNDSICVFSMGKESTLPFYEFMMTTYIVKDGENSLKSKTKLYMSCVDIIKNKKIYKKPYRSQRPDHYYLCGEDYLYEESEDTDEEEESEEFESDDIEESNEDILEELAESLHSDSQSYYNSQEEFVQSLRSIPNFPESQAEFIETFFSSPDKIELDDSMWCNASILRCADNSVRSAASPRLSLTPLHINISKHNNSRLGQCRGMLVFNSCFCIDIYDDYKVSRTYSPIKDIAWLLAKTSGCVIRSPTTVMMPSIPNLFANLEHPLLRFLKGEKVKMSVHHINDMITDVKPIFKLWNMNLKDRLTKYLSQNETLL